jgi:hypothetical protein
MGVTPKLIVLCDGMWCSAETKSETNLRMLARLVGINFEKREDSLHDERCQARYFAGPGLGTPLDLVATGKLVDDIGTRCIDIYKYIADNFTAKHEVWMFGLGRGAYVIRCVAGMVANCGILKATGDDHETRVLAQRAYTMYVNQTDSLSSMSKFRSTSSWAVERPIKFIGLLDTTSPKGFAVLSSIATASGFPWRLHPPCHDADVLRVAEMVYHAVAMHERLPFSDLCPLRPPYADEKQASRPRNVHEKWFPGMHYDLARQEFSLHPLGGGLPHNSLLSWSLGQRVQPNAVISDLVLMWMLEKIQAADPSGTVVPDVGRRIEEFLHGFAGDGTQPTGSGDIYDNILEYTPLAPLRLWWSYLPDSFTQHFVEFKRRWLESVLGLGGRKILDVGAETYDYRRPFDQSGETIENLAQLSRERYPSTAYDDFHLFRRLTGEIDQGTFLCLAGKEHESPQKPPGASDLGEHTVLDVEWQGPEFYALHRGHRDRVDWARVLTITKASAAGEYYIARTVSGFLSEFYGDMGISLLEWVDKLCTFRTREVPKEMGEERSPSANAKNASGMLHRLHLHVSEDSVTACFADASLDWRIPATCSDKIDRALSALRWVVSVFQSPEGASGTFRVGCKDDDINVRSSRWEPYREPFEPGKEECSCWTQLFDVTYVADMPPSLHYDVRERPEGLEIDWNQLLDLTVVSRFRHTDDGVILFGTDIALIQRAPVETRLWHVVRRPGEFIPTLPLEKALASSHQPSEPPRELEFLSTIEPVGASSDLEAGAIKSWVKWRRDARRAKSDLEDFQYPAGSVYVGWCCEPIVTMGTTAPTREFLERFDEASEVRRVRVTDNIVALASVNNVRVWNLGFKLGFMGFGGVDGTVGGQHGEEAKVPPLAIDLRQRRLFSATLRSLRATPCILWDDTLRRAWLVPGTCALLFISLCYFALLELTFDGEVRYATPSNDPATSAETCLIENRSLRLTNEGEPEGVTFGALVLELWHEMEQAQRVCWSTPSNVKHAKEGVVFGYDLHDLLGTGHVALRYLDRNRAGPSLPSWEPLARLDTTQVIFCKSVGQVIRCASEKCPGAPCRESCERTDVGPPGVLACLLQDFRRFFSEDWDRYAQSGTLLVQHGFEWVPRGPDPFGHNSRSAHVPGAPCQCCAQVNRLQAIEPVRRESFLARHFRRLFRFTRRDYFRNAMWLDQRLAVRFGPPGGNI